MCKIWLQNNNRVRGENLSHDYPKYILILVVIILLCAFVILGNSTNTRICEQSSIYIIDDFSEGTDSLPHGLHVLGKVCDSFSGNYSNIYCVNIELGKEGCVEQLNQVLRELTNENVDLINMSFGMDAYNENTYNLLQQLGDNGVIIVAAAGNAGKETCQYPAGYDLDCVFSIGAADANGQIASYSNYGKSVDVFVETPNTNEPFSGTSAACAIFTNQLLKANVMLNRVSIEKYIVEHSEIIRKGDYRYYYISGMGEEIHEKE